MDERRGNETWVISDIIIIGHFLLVRRRGGLCSLTTSEFLPSLNLINGRE
jgi:hypothetical protein